MNTTERLHRVIAKTNKDNDVVQGAVVRNWVVIADWVGVDGEKYMTHCVSDGTTSWEVVGLLQTASDHYRNITATEEDDG